MALYLVAQFCIVLGVLRTATPRPPRAAQGTLRAA
jgi:hypothetical protein